MHQSMRPPINYSNTEITTVQTILRNPANKSIFAQFTASPMPTERKRGLWRNVLHYCTMLLLLCTCSAALAGLHPFEPGVDLGEQIFKHTCSVCHGEKGGGAVWGKLDPPARIFTSPEAAAKLTRERMINSITYGRAGTAMQPFGGQLSTSEIEAVTDFITRTFIVNAEISDMSLPMPNKLKGDRIKGSSLYQLNCSPCHGQSGDGKGPRAYFINPKPRNLLLPESRRWLNRPTLFRVISQGSRGTEMPAWDKVFDEQQTADVAEFVFQRFTRPNQLLNETGNSRK